MGKRMKLFGMNGFFYNLLALLIYFGAPILALGLAVYDKIKQLITR